MARTCDWCGELEPEEGAFDSKDEEIRSMQTVLCPQHSPDSEVKRGIYILYSFTAHSDKHSVPEAMAELCESGLSYISDRFVDGSHDTDSDTNLPNPDRLKTIADELEQWRKEWIIRTCNFQINAEAINDYLGEDYIRED